MSLHICLLSDQLLANYLPIKYDLPEKIFYITTKYVEDKGLHTIFEKMIKDLNKAEDLDIEIIKAKNMVPNGNFNTLYEYFLNIPEEIQQLNATDITLNITGGTKLMALAAYDMLKPEVNRVIYTNTQDSQIEILDDNLPIKLPSLLNIEESLNVYGISPKSYNNESEEWCEKVDGRKGITKNIANFFTSEEHNVFLSNLNYLAQKSITTTKTETGGLVSRLSDPVQTFNYVNRKEANILKTFVDCGFIEYDNEKTIHFNSIEAAQYLGGFWLEEYVYHVAKDAGVDHVRCGQAIQSSKKNRNEIDIVMVHNNRLLLIECKTSKQGKDEQKDSQIVYKLDSIAEDFKGLYGEAWIVSIHNLTEPTKERAKVQKIDIISGNEIKNLKEMIIEWMNSK